MAKAHAAARALSIACLQILVDALFTEYVAALGNDDVLLTLVTNVAVEQLAHCFHLHKHTYTQTHKHLISSEGATLEIEMPSFYRHTYTHAHHAHTYTHMRAHTHARK